MTRTARRRLYAAVGAAAVLAAVLIVWGARRGTARLITADAVRGEFLVTVNTTGQVEAVNSRMVSRLRVGGSWNAVQIVQMAPEGSVVEEGDFLVQLDTNEARQSIDQAENELLNARAELERQQATSASQLAELESAVLNQQYGYEQAKLRYDQMQYEAEVRRREQELELKKAELSLQEARDRLAAQRVIAEAERSKAESDVRRAEMQREQAQKALESLTITAPEPGLVVYRTFRGGKVKVGDQAWPGMEIIELPDLSSMQVRTRVNEIDVRQVEVGQEVEVAVDALADRSFHGEVSRIATLARAEGEAKVKVFDVDVLLDGEGGDLRPGMTAQCRIVTARVPDAVSVPLEAVFERDGESVVYVVAGGIHARPVVLGPRNDDFVVVESGIAEGDVVSLRDPSLPAASTPAAETRTPAAEKRPPGAGKRTHAPREARS